ncbi:MAG TPA: translation initiation factor IF-3 [Bacteroidia bacterium]|nr:translation initiation factor IF-3 [Bacteroidia bacterium]
MKGKVQRQDEHNINENIRAPRVRVIADGIEPAIYPIQQALLMAKDAGLDLVEIAPNADPPVCKIIDYKKFLYEHRKKQKEIKAKSSKVTIKEIRFGPNTDEHDFVFKKNHAQKFLEEGAKVKAFVLFKGRTILFKEKGELMLLRFAQDLSEYGKVEQLPLLEGKKMMMTLAPKPKK